MSNKIKRPPTLESKETFKILNYEVTSKFWPDIQYVFTKLHL
jgi:hypothetical protein